MGPITLNGFGLTRFSLARMSVQPGVRHGTQYYITLYIKLSLTRCRILSNFFEAVKNLNHILEDTFHISIEQLLEHGGHLYLKLKDSINPLSNVRKNSIIRNHSFNYSEEVLNLINKLVNHLYENMCKNTVQTKMTDFFN